MHIVVIAWLFVTATMALTLGAAAGTMFFAVLGVAPVALYAWLLVRRRAAARARLRAAGGAPAATLSPRARRAPRR